MVINSRKMYILELGIFLACESDAQFSLVIKVSSKASCKGDVFYGQEPPGENRLPHFVESINNYFSNTTTSVTTSVNGQLATAATDSGVRDER